MAECAGYSHEIVETYDGNFVRHLRDNAVTCLRRHLSWYCPDLGAWQRLVPRFASVECPVVFNGDGPGWRVRRLPILEMFGEPANLRGGCIVLVILSIAERQPGELRARLSGGFRTALCCRVPRVHGHWHNAIDFVYLDQRLGTLILPWREACIPPGVAVRSPLLDNDVLDFLMRVPAAARSNRNLYRKTITAMYPQLYRFPRCSTLSNYYLNLAQEFAINVAEVAQIN